MTTIIHVVLLAQPQAVLLDLIEFVTESYEFVTHELVTESDEIVTQIRDFACDVNHSCGFAGVMLRSS